VIEAELALERALSEGDEWQSWRALRLSGETLSVPSIPYQDESGGVIGPTGATSPGATGEALCHLVVLGLRESAPAESAIAWLESARTPAGAWLDDPAQVPGEADEPAAGRVWATASAACALLAVGRDPGNVALALLRGEADKEGRFTGGAYPTFAAAGAYWLSVGPKSEMAEWALRWTREWEEDWWGPWEWATALTFWGAAGIRAEHPSVESFLDLLEQDAPAAGWADDLGLTLRTLELLAHFEGR
jgi:hypothetical protein